MVSIIMPTFNRANVIMDSIKSVLSQTYSDIELIIIDDGSIDNTAEMVGEIPDSRIRYIRLDSNYGQSHARNVGIEAAQGDYIAFLDSDNEWDKEHLKGRVQLVSSISEPFISYSRVRMKEEKEEQWIFPKEIDESISEKRNELLKIMCIANQFDTNAVLIDRRCLFEEKFDESLLALEDWELFFRIIRNEKNRIIFDHRITVTHNLQPDSLSKDYSRYIVGRIGIIHSMADIFREEYNECLKGDIWLMENRYSLDILIEAIYKLPENLKSTGLEYLSRICYGFSEQKRIEIEVTRKNLRMYRNITELENICSRISAKRIAIYGYGHFGKILYDELQKIHRVNPEIAVAAVIDQKCNAKDLVGVVYTNDISSVSDYDAIIVSVLNGSEEIVERLQKQTDKKVYSLMNI